MPKIGNQGQSKLGRRVLAVALACALFAAVVVRPAPAYADTREAFIYAGIGVGVYIAVIVVATLLIYRTATPDTSAIPLDALLRDDVARFPLQAGTRCVQRDGQVTLICW